MGVDEQAFWGLIIEETPGGIRVRLDGKGLPVLVLDSDDYIPPIPYCPLCLLRAELRDYAATSGLIACVRKHKFRLSSEGATRGLECVSSRSSEDKGKKFIQVEDIWQPVSKWNWISNWIT